MRESAKGCARLSTVIMRLLSSTPRAVRVRARTEARRRHSRLSTFFSFPSKLSLPPCLFLHCRSTWHTRQEDCKERHTYPPLSLSQSLFCLPWTFLPVQNPPGPPSMPVAVVVVVVCYGRQESIVLAVCEASSARYSREAWRRGGSARGLCCSIALAGLETWRFKRSGSEVWEKRVREGKALKGEGSDAAGC